MSAASVKLSPAIKALIALPSARGRSIPSPRPDLLHGLFRRVVGKGEKGGVGRDTWLTLCTAGVMTVNSPESLVGLYEFASERVGGAVEERARNAAVSLLDGVGTDVRAVEPGPSRDTNRWGWS
jgi:hypothetical protein